MTVITRELVLDAPGHLTVVEGAVDNPVAPGEVLLKVKFCGLCGTDRHAVLAKEPDPRSLGVAIGHEILAEVVDAGSTDLATGSSVVVIPNFPCGSCSMCQTNRRNLCRSFVHLGSLAPGGLASHIVVHREYLVPVPEGADPIVMTLSEPMACILNGINKAEIGAGTRVLVLGAGPIGQLYAATAALQGALEVAVVDVNSERLDTALEVGATSVHQAGAVPEALKLGFDVVFDTVGTLLASAIEYAAPGGRIFVFGLESKPVEIANMNRIVIDEIEIHGVYIGRGTMPEAVQILSEHTEHFRPIVSDVFQFDQWQEAFKLLIDGSATGKVLIRL